MASFGVCQQKLKHKEIDQYDARTDGQRFDRCRRPGSREVFLHRTGLTLEGETTVEGPLIGQLIGLKNARATLAMLRTPDGQGVELDKFHTSEAVRHGLAKAPVNTLSLHRIMFNVSDIGEVVARMQAFGA